MLVCTGLSSFRSNRSCSFFNLKIARVSLATEGECERKAREGEVKATQPRLRMCLCLCFQSWFHSS